MEPTRPTCFSCGSEQLRFANTSELVLVADRPWTSVRRALVCCSCGVVLDDPVEIGRRDATYELQSMVERGLRMLEGYLERWARFDAWLEEREWWEQSFPPSPT